MSVEPGNTALGSEWVVLLIVHTYLGDGLYHIHLLHENQISYNSIISMMDTNINTSYCQIINEEEFCVKSDSKALSTGILY